ncbi:MmgE/PrpD family protein [Paraburkholderia sp. J10-1]|uniref:MmgE/PrpD family protein n=1 Tax=Paraburkholderia sp. J10-1 TaxID=2805430 RepID=UPI002AB64BD6|nr:MmgE/PrpD family protein [Paraburkholderia sp. J10-1]
MIADSLPSSQSPLFWHLAEFAGHISFGNFPEAVLTEAKYCLLDTIGCMIAGASLAESVDFARAEAAMSEKVEARIVGRQLRLSAMAAARVNGYSGDVLELNDLIGGHASIGAVAAVLALAEVERLDGMSLLRALIAGIEVTARINMAYRESHGGRDNKAFTDVGVSSEGIPSTIGVGALTSVALGLKDTQIANALAIAGTLAGWCPVEVLFGPSSTIKPIMFGGWPASVGMLAGRYASHGLTGPRDLLESPVGLYATLAKGFDADILKGSLGWQLEKPRRKWHACCGFTHAGIDGAIKLRRAHGGSIFDNARIEIFVVPPVAELMGSAKAPTTETEARFSGKYCVALGARGADRIVPDHSSSLGVYMTDPAIRDLVERIEYRPMESLPHFSHSRVRVSGPEGERASVLVTGYKGSQSNPLTHAEVEAKFRDLTAGKLKDPEGYIAKILTMEKATDLDWLYDDVISAI